MRPHPKFVGLPKQFWAYVRSVSEQCGYSVRGQGRVKQYSIDDLKGALQRLNLGLGPVERGGDVTTLGRTLLDYFAYRAEVLNTYVVRQLLNGDEAAALYAELCAAHQRQAPAVPVNKQSGEKRTINYMTAMVNLVVASQVGDRPCNYCPRGLTTITRGGMPLRTLSRWLDGAFPSIVNPLATWEIKEYYHTTSFGSKVSDAVYVAQLDGMELEELRTAEEIDVYHYLFVDARDNWWNKGKSYLCRVVDMLHMGYAREVVFGREVADRLPDIVRGWTVRYDERIEAAVDGQVPGAGDEPKSTDTGE